MGSRASLAQRADRQADGRAWLQALREGGSAREEAAAALHELLLKAARFELRRRQAILDGHHDSLDDLAVQSADNALSAILAKLDDYRGESRFTTWAYKFAILEASVAARRKAWQTREVPQDPQAWDALAVRAPDMTEDLANRERLRDVTRAIRGQLSVHQREVLTALVLGDVPIDVLAERLNTTRGALYKTLHDARRRLRAAVGGERDD